jgi:diaminopimelate epimerase
MPLKFTKMHGLGNDFIIIDAINQSVQLSPQQLARLADRHTGIGFDQCLLVEKSPHPDIDFLYRIFNADGQEVGQCGNGARCLARFVTYYGLTQNRTIRIATKTTQMTCTLHADDTVTVDMGLPCWDPKTIPLLADQVADTYKLPIEDSLYHFHALSVGNPHAIILMNDLEDLDILTIGKAISEHPLFPEQCNASFMQLINSNQIQLRVYERGAGETSACGSAAVAAAAVAIRFYQSANTVNVILPGGSLRVDWPNQQGNIQLTGSADFVYEGELLPCVL